MKGTGEFMYKSIEAREGGKFTNDKGQEINYDACYQLNCDDLETNSVKFKVLTKDKELVETFRSFKPYTKVKIDFDIVIKNNNCKIIPIAVQKMQ